MTFIKLVEGYGSMESLWNSLLCFINSNSALWSFLVTIATIVYVILTYRLLRETAKARKLQSQPYIIADLVLKGISLKMIVKNIGNNCALNVKVEVEPAINNPFSKIDFLAPEREISNVIKYITHGEAFNLENSKYKFKIFYEDPYKEKYNHEYSIDISPLLNATNYNESENKEIVDKLNKILPKFDSLKDELHSIADSSKKTADYLKDIKSKFK